MALALYDELFWFPSGVIATNVVSRVFLLETNILASLFADQAGTVPIANPLVTSNAGRLTFYAEQGQYWLHLDTESFLIEVGGATGEPPGVDELAGRTLSTGVATGGVITVTGPSSVTISATTGVVVDASDQFAEPNITEVSTPQSVVALSAASLARTVTWWMIDIGGAVIQTGTRPTNETHRDFIVLGSTFYDVVNATLTTAQSSAQLLVQPMAQTFDLFRALGAVNIRGNEITPFSSALELSKSAGTFFLDSWNYYDNADNPHIGSSAFVARAPLFHIARGTVMLPSSTLILDVANYDNSGNVNPVGGDTNRSTVFRVFLRPSGTSGGTVIVQYGQTVYPDLATAADSIGRGGYIVNPNLDTRALLLAHIAVRHTAANLMDSTQAIFQQAANVLPIP